MFQWIRYENPDLEINRDHAIGDWRPTVAVILCGLPSRAVGLVQPAKEPTGTTYIPPQGGIELGESLEAAMYREIHQELGITVEEVRFVEYLGTALNFLPASRRAMQHSHGKKLYFVRADTRRMALAPASEENRAATWCYDPIGLVNMMVFARETKAQATVTAVRAAGIWPNSRFLPADLQAA